MNAREKLTEPFSESLGTTFVRLLIAIVFSIAFGYIEAAVVVYLRAIFHPGGFTFPMSVFGKDPASTRLVLTEIGREAATIVLIFTGAWLFGRDRRQRIAYFMVIFAIWDIFYYVWLKVLLDWPASIMDWDILFLIPVTWASPIFYPVLMSMTMLVFAIVILVSSCLARPVKTTFLEWFAFCLSGLIIVQSFCIAGLHITEPDYASYFYRWMFFAGYLLSVTTFLVCLLKSGAKTPVVAKESKAGPAAPAAGADRPAPPTIRGGGLHKPVLGMTIAEDHVVKRLGAEGVLVVTVTPGGPADKAGLRPTRRDEQGKIERGDLIVAIDNKAIGESRDLYQALDVHQIGDTVRLRVRRPDGDCDLQVELQARP